MDNLLILMRFLHFLSVMGFFGACLFPFYAAEDRSDGPRSALWSGRVMWRVTCAATSLALLSGLGWLCCEAVLMSGNPDGYKDPGVIATLLTKTEFGRVWLLRLCVFILATVYLIASGSRIIPFKLWPMLTCGLFFVVSLAPVGHGAMGAGSDVWLHLVTQALHLISASVWVGGLGSLFYIVRRARGSQQRTEKVTFALRRFSTVGVLAVLVLMATGGLNSWFLVGSKDALLHTTYGQVLMIKLAFFLAMVSIALFNRFFLLPGLAHAPTADAPLRRLATNVGVEQIFAVFVLFSVSVLGMLPPAFNMIGMNMK